jgi:hypothetical protein
MTADGRINRIKKATSSGRLLKNILMPNLSTAENLLYPDYMHDNIHNIIFPMSSKAYLYAKLA